MAFIRTRTINGKQYRYLEERWREGKKVKSRSTYLGTGDGHPVGGYMDMSLADMARTVELDNLKRAEKEKAPPPMKVEGPVVTPTSLDAVAQSSDQNATDPATSPR